MSWAITFYCYTTRDLKHSSLPQKKIVWLRTHFSSNTAGHNHVPRLPLHKMRQHSFGEWHRADEIEVQNSFIDCEVSLGNQRSLTTTRVAHQDVNLKTILSVPAVSVMCRQKSAMSSHTWPCFCGTRNWCTAARTELLRCGFLICTYRRTCSRDQNAGWQTERCRYETWNPKDPHPQRWRLLALCSKNLHKFMSILTGFHFWLDVRRYLYNIIASF